MDYITFEVRSYDLNESDIIELGSKVRIYRSDVFKSNSDGNGGFLKTLQALTDIIIYP